MADDDKPRVFLSHSRSEGPFVREVANELQRRGMDARSVTDEQGGDRVEYLPRNVFDSAECVVVFMGAADEPANVYFEIGAALGASKPIVPVYLSEQARGSAPGVVSKLDGIDAHDLKPDQVAEELAHAIGGARH
jgi:TIR domain